MPDKKYSFEKHRKFFAFFLIAFLAIIVPFTILISQQSQEMRQRAQVPGITPVHFSVSIEQLGFSPATITVPQGAIITWINHDTVPHTTTSAIQGTQDSWDSHGLASAQIFSQQFVTPGTYTYRCILHPQHQGTIIVQPSSNISTPTPTKTTTIAPTVAPTSQFFPTPTVYCLGACLTSTPGGSAYPTYSYTNTPTPSSQLTTSPAPTDPNETPKPTTDPLSTETPTPTDSGHNGGNGNGSAKGLFALLLGIMIAILEFIFTLLGKK